VVQVSWHAASEYCIAQGKRLPREAEWELAARGTERRVFPWGAEAPACDGVTFARGPKLPCESQGAHPSDVGTSRVDVTPEGVHDLGGNVAEWVEDGFAERYAECGDCRDPQGKASRLVVVRGGFWGLTSEAARSAGRSRLARDTMKGDIGFRCAKSIEGTP
jgi:serine/threonine-protein kinase